MKRRMKMGLVRTRHSLCYGQKHGWFMWLPGWAKRAIVKIWNNISCYTMGHEIYGPWDLEDGMHIDKFCSSCSKKWKD